MLLRKRSHLMIFGMVGEEKMKKERDCVYFICFYEFLKLFLFLYVFLLLLKTSEQNFYLFFGNCSLFNFGFKNCFQTKRPKNAINF